jgi:DNA-binding protein Alba
MQDKGASEIVLKAMGRAINKTVTIAEIIKVLLLLHLSL